MKTIKQTALDFVRENGPCTHGEIKRVMFEYRFGKGTYHSFEHRGWYTSYFSEDSQGKGAILLKGQERLVKNSKGLYTYVNRKK